MKKRDRRELNDGTGRSCLNDGSLVGGYEVELLCAGGMSVVYVGRRGEEVRVLKEVPADDTMAVPALMAEKSLMERLSHPAIARCDRLLSEGGFYYLVMEYVQGEPLSTWLRSERRAGVEQVVDWSIQLADVFHYLHTRKPPIVYRDLKPENVLLSPEGLKLIDFGIARLHKGDRDSDTSLLGSPATASPEHYGAAETDARSDIFTLGATAFELLTGGTHQRASHLRFPPLRDVMPEVPLELARIYDKALQFDPEERYQTALEFRDALLRATGQPIPQTPVDPLAEEPVEERTVPLQQAVTRTALPEQPPAPRSNRKSALLGLAVLVVVVLGLAGVVPRKGASQEAGPYQNSPAVLEEKNLDGDIFFANRVDDRDVVMLGEDIGLFQVKEWSQETAEERAGTIASRLNRFYHEFCTLCGRSKLEPRDVKVGTYTETGDTVVFYAHVHDDGKIFAGPIVLATANEDQAAELGVDRASLAAAWRNLLRDTVQLSRGFALPQSALGEELSAAFSRARTELDTGEVSIANLRKVLQEVTGSEALHLRRQFLKVPDGEPELDNFTGVRGLEPLPGAAQK